MNRIFRLAVLAVAALSTGCAATICCDGPTASFNRDYARDSFSFGANTHVLQGGVYYSPHSLY